MGYPDQAARIVFAEARPEIAAACAAAAKEDHVLLKIAAPPAEAQAHLTAGYAVRAVTVFMESPHLDAGRTLGISAEARIQETSWGVRVEILAEAGETAARGGVALVEGLAVFDRIETAAAHRRKGLGALVMRLLSSEALARGARRGALVATADGRALYETLGWSVSSPYVTAARK